MSIASLALPSPRVLLPTRADPQSVVRPSWAEISLSDLRHNFNELSRVMGTPVWPVLKADAYGHGAKAVARSLVSAGAQGLCVSLLEEAIELREAGIAGPILVMGSNFAGACEQVVVHGLTPVVSRVDQVEELAREAARHGAGRVPVHVKLDTGMARLGCSLAELSPLLARIAAHRSLFLEGLMTHLASAGEDPEAVAEQLRRFALGERQLKAGGIRGVLRHAANTAGGLLHPESRFDFVRVGIGVFGYAPGMGGGVDLRPVLRLRTEVVALRRLVVGESVGYGGEWRASRPSHVATVSLGYADGVSRALGNRGYALVRGRRAPIVGRVSMDMITLDVTDLAGVALGDEVVFIGHQRGPLGEDSIRAEEVAAQAGTICWEVLTSISRRVPRFFVGEATEPV